MTVPDLQGLIIYWKTDFIENLEAGNFTQRVQVQGKSMGATKEGAPHAQVRMGFFEDRGAGS